MPLFKSFQQKRRAGKRYDGYACWCDDYTAVPRPGFYALDATGKIIQPHIPLVCIDDAPGDPHDGACHYVYAGPKDNPYGQAPTNIVPIEAHDAIGRGVTSA